MIGPFLIAVSGSAATALIIALCARIEWPYVLLLWIALVPWLAVVDRARSAAAAALCGLLLAELWVALLFPWIPRAISDYSGAPFLVSASVTALIAPLLQPQFIPSALARHLARRLGCGAALIGLVGACAYVAAEGLLPKLLADTVGHGLYASPYWRQGADIGGAHGLTLLVLLVNDAVLAAWRASWAPAPRRRGARARALLCIALVPSLLALYGAVRLAQLDGGGAAPVTIGIVQGNVSHYDRLAEKVGTFEAVRRILEPYVELSGPLLEHHALDLLVWPETVYPTSFGAPKSAAGADFDRAIAALVARSGVPLLFGTYERDGEHEYNVAVLLEAAGDARVDFDAYRKTMLFPFTEYVPAWLDGDWLRARLPWAGHWQAGHGARVLQATLAHGRALRIAPMICYDAIAPGLVLPAVRQGAELLVTLSNDSWFAYPGVQRLILIVSAFRSIETRRPQIRATPTGISAVISATGALTDRIDANQRGTLVASVAPSQAARTLMVAWGDWLPPAALVVGLVILGLMARRRPAP